MESRRILIVEDDDNLSSLFTDLLTGEGFHVDIADDGEKGLQKIEQGGWSLILLDIILPGINGIDIMKKVRQNPPTLPNGPVVFTTNLYDDLQQKEAAEMGCGYLIKGNLTPDAFLKEIKKYLS